MPAGRPSACKRRAQDSAIDAQMQIHEEELLPSSTDRQNPLQNIQLIYSRHEQKFEDSIAQPVYCVLGRDALTREMLNLLQFERLTARGRSVPLAL